MERESENEEKRLSDAEKVIILESVYDLWCLVNLATAMANSVVAHLLHLRAADRVAIARLREWLPMELPAKQREMTAVIDLYEKTLAFQRAQELLKKKLNKVSK
jgi:hypothetical protein